MISLLNKLDLKNFKVFYKLSNIHKILNESHFIFFYYYDYLSQKDIIILKQFINEYQLNYCLLDKKSIKIITKENKNFNELTEFMQGNVIIIYQLNQKFLSSNFIDIIFLLKKKLSKIILFGFKYENNFYKDNKISNITSYDNLNKKFIIFNLLNIIRSLYKTIIYLR